MIEYPVGKEVKVTLTPVSLEKSKAAGTILRDDTGTSIILNLTDVPADVSAINVYAVDDTGAVTLLGPVVLADGKDIHRRHSAYSHADRRARQKPAAYDPNTKVYFVARA